MYALSSFSTSHPHQHLIFSVFVIIAIFVSVMYHLIVVWVGNSLTTNGLVYSDFHNKML